MCYFCIFAPQTHAVWDVVRGRVCGHIKRRLLTLCGGLFGTSQLSKTKPRRVAVNVLWMCIITVPTIQAICIFGVDFKLLVMVWLRHCEGLKESVTSQ